MGGTAEEFTMLVKKDMKRWAAAVKAAGIKVECNREQKSDGQHGYA